VTYLRRKQDAQCFNGEDLERVVKREPCNCIDFDYECDYGYKVGSDSGTKCEFQGDKKQE